MLGGFMLEAVRRHEQSSSQPLSAPKDANWSSSAVTPSGESTGKCVKVYN